MEGILSDDPVSQLEEDLPAKQYALSLTQLDTAHLNLDLQIDLLNREQAQLKEAHGAIVAEMSVQAKMDALRKGIPSPKEYVYARTSAEMVARADPAVHAKALEAWKRKRARMSSNASSDS